MLVLTRRVGEEIVIANNIHIKVVSIKGDRIRIGITAPENVTVDRAEVHIRRTQFAEVPVTPEGEADSSVVLLGQLPRHAGESDDTFIH